MPEFRLCSMRHIKDILSGRKDFFYAERVRAADVPNIIQL